LSFDQYGGAIDVGENVESQVSDEVAA